MPTLDESNSSLALVAAVKEELGALRASVAALQEEVGRLRDWRHGLGNTLMGLAVMPGTMAELSGELRALRQSVTDLQMRLAQIDAVRLAHERTAVWLRWAIGGGWAIAAFTAIAAWVQHLRSGQP